MGTTAEKLKYLNETKAEIKNALETPYNVMRDYPELIKKYIDNQPTKVVTDGICGNAVDVPVKTIETNGNIRQETTEGYNLLNIESKFKVTGSERIPISLPAGEYTIKADNIVTDSSSQTSFVTSFRTSSEAIADVRLTLSNHKLKFTLLKPATFAVIYSGNSFNESQGVTTTYTNLMVYEGTSDKPYEPYTGGIPSPSPDYIQKITSIGGYDNLFDKNNIISGSYVSDGNGAFVSNSTSKRTDYIEIQANSYYYIYSDKTSGNWGAWYDKDKNFISGITLGGKKEGVVNSPANAKYMAFTISYQGNLTDYSKIKINETAIKIKHSGKNKLDFKKILKSANVTYTEQDGVFNLANAGNLYSVPYKLDLKPNTTYTIYQNFQEQNSTNVRLTISRGSKYEKVVESYSTSKTESYRKKTFTTDESSDYYIRGDWSLLHFPLIYNEPILVEGADDASYEPYHEPIITPINLQGNILSKVGDVKDILKINRNGRVTIRKNIGKVTFVGDDTYAWNMSNSSITGLNAFWILISRYNQLNWKQKIQTKSSNYFTYYQKEWKQVTEPCICENTDLKPDMCIFSGFDSNMSLTKWKEWLSQHPTEVYYELATPQIITLPSISPIELWQGTNIFKLITNLDTDFEVEYIVDKDSVLNEVQTAMLEAEI